MIRAIPPSRAHISASRRSCCSNLFHWTALSERSKLGIGGILSPLIACSDLLISTGLRLPRYRDYGESSIRNFTDRGTLFCLSARKPIVGEVSPGMVHG